MKTVAARLLGLFLLSVVLAGCVQIRQPVLDSRGSASGFAALGTGPVLFSDGFESGNFQSWTSVSGLVLQQQSVAEGSWAARGTLAGSGAFASVTLTAQTELTASLRMQLVSISGTSAVNFLKLRTATGTALAEVYVTPAGRLGLRNAVTGVATDSALTYPLGSWQSVSLRAVVAGNTSLLELSLNGAVVLQQTANLGTTAIGRIQIGENVSGRTAELLYDSVAVTGAEPPAAPVLFSDNFETGSLQLWTSVSGLTTQQQVVAEGVWAARGTMTGSGASAYKALTLPVTEITASLRVQLISISGTSAVNFFKVRTAAGTALAEVYVTPAGILGLRNNVTLVATNSTQTLPLGVWQTITLKVVVAGSSSRLELSLNNMPLANLQQTVNLGTTPIGRVQLGESVAGRTADLAYDSLTVTGAIPSPDPVLVAAGDIACDPLNPKFLNGVGAVDACRQKAVSDLFVNDSTVKAVAALGDVQYYCGGAAAFAASYDPSWGRLKPLTRPAVGNHEYITTGGTTPATDCDPTGQALGYYNYFGTAAGAPNQGYYSYELGTWHIIVLNSNCGQAGGCSTGSPQDNWLQADLAAHPTLCTLAYWHIPLWSSGGRAEQNSLKFVQRLYAAGADVILTGHDHTYERFAPQNAAGAADPNGIRAFVVGTGGANHTTIPTVAPNSEVRNASTFGVLRLTLHAGSYDWQFVPEPGKTFTDSGSSVCH